MQEQQILIVFFILLGVMVVLCGIVAINNSHRLCNQFSNKINPDFKTGSIFKIAF